MKTDNKKDNEQCAISSVSSSAGCSYSITPRLRYVKKHIPIDEQSATWELRLQQMWQGSDGSEDWQWVEVEEQHYC